MGFFDFFKKKPEIKIEKIRFSELESWIKSKKEQNKAKETEVTNLISESVSQLIVDLKDKNRILRKVDLNEKKVEDRIKFIVEENLSYYINYLEKLIKSLENLKNSENKSLNLLINELDSFFLDFEQKSRMSFEKATFLIGKELGNVKEAINNFVANLKKTLEQNKAILENFNVISLLESKLGEVNNIEVIESGINQKIEKIKQKIKNSNKEIDKIKREIEDIKDSEEYKGEKSKEESIVLALSRLEKEIYKLKEMIGFKELAKAYHIIPETMALINNYKNNFKITFEKDNGEELSELLKKNSEIQEKIKQIQELKKQIENKESEFEASEGKKVIEGDFKIKKINQEIWESNTEISKEEKRKEKLEENKKDKLNEIKQELVKAGVDVNYD